MTDFVSDGCTGFLQTWFGIDLTKCCYAHDLAWYQHPGDWSAWINSNAALAKCFTDLGLWYLAVPVFLAVSTIGALLFARKRRKKPDGR